VTRVTDLGLWVRRVEYCFEGLHDHLLLSI
jgi:hypothetical protein